MTRDMALRVDMLLTGVRACLDSIASYMKNHVSRKDLTQEELTKYLLPIGKSMGATIELSRMLYELFPNIVPDELKC